MDAKRRPVESVAELVAAGFVHWWVRPQGTSKWVYVKINNMAGVWYNKRSIEYFGPILYPTE